MTASRTGAKQLRCAVYTRKSTEESLEHPRPSRGNKSPANEFVLYFSSGTPMQRAG